MFHSFISHYFAAKYHVLKRYPDIELVNHTFILQQSVVFHSFISHYFAAKYHVLKRYPEIELVIVR